MSQIVPAGAASSQDANGSIVTVHIICMVFSGLALTARLAARRIKHQKLSISDYFCICGLLGAWAISLIAIQQGRLGLGRHVGSISFANLREILILTYAAEILYSISFVLIKLSILLLYHVLLPGRDVFIANYTIGAFVIMWGVAVLLVSIFSCNPIHGFWDVTIESQCIDSEWFFVGNSIPNIIADIAILAIPMYKVQPLRMSVRSKFAVLGMFLLGGFVIVASGLRIYFMVEARMNDIRYTFQDVGLWSTIEINVAVISASLPTIRPLLRYCRSKLSSRIVPASSIDTIPKSTKGDKDKKKKEFWFSSESTMEFDSGTHLDSNKSSVGSG